MPRQGVPQRYIGESIPSLTEMGMFEPAHKPQRARVRQHSAGTANPEGRVEDAPRATSEGRHNLIGTAKRGDGAKDLAALMSHRGKFPHVRLFLMRSDGGREFPSNYNAFDIFAGKLSYAIRVDKDLGALVNVKVGESRHKFDIAPIVASAANKWRTLLGDAPLVIEKLDVDEDDEEELEPNLLVLTEQNVPLARGVAFTQPLQSYYQSSDFSTYSVMKFNENFEIKGAVYDDLKSYVGSENSDALINMFYYAAALHEFGHVLGLAHPQEEKGVQKSDPIPVAGHDDPALMNADVMEFLAAVYRRNDHKPFSIDMINPSSGEIEALRNSMRRAP